MIDIFKALGDENRLRIVNLLINAELCVCEIETILEMTQSNVSRHLNKLKNAGIINSFKDAQWVHYRLNDKYIKKYDLMINQIKQYFLEEFTYQEDLRRYNNYKKNNLSCQDIRTSKEKVLEIIK